MANIVVSGLINVETTLRVDGFPLHYQPVRFPVHSVGPPCRVSAANARAPCLR